MLYNHIEAIFEEITFKVYEVICKELKDDREYNKLSRSRDDKINMLMKSLNNEQKQLLLDIEDSFNKQSIIELKRYTQKICCIMIEVLKFLKLI